MDVRAVLPHQALVDGAVLRVDRDEPAGARERHEQVAADDERLLVCVHEGLAGLERGISRVDAREAHDRVHDAVHVLCGRDAHEALLPKAHLAGRGEFGKRWVVPMRLVRDHDVRAAKLARRLHGERDGVVHGNGHHAQAVRMLAADFERLRADRSGRA